MALQDRKRTTIVWLGLFLLLALTLRIAFNVTDSFHEETGQYLYSGNDPYYHDRTLTYIMEEGEHLLFDPSINYPDGLYNPNPPLYDWTAVPLAAGLDAAGVADPVGLALNIMVAVWGAITIFPVYSIARDLWGRGAGLWAAFFMAVSAPHIQRGVFGFADHDATTMFWIAAVFAFLIKAIQSLERREYVSDWTDSGARTAGLRAAWVQNKTAFAWSLLAGLALTATALTWKGYPYVLAVMAVALSLQLLQDHLKNRDSTAVWGIYLLPLAMVALLPWLLYYRLAPVFFGTTIEPSLYVLIGAIGLGAILVPTRDVPSVVVFPGLVLAGLAGLAILYFAFPGTWYTIFSGLGYFQQSKLYTTIAEAQRSSLGRVAASFGFFTFLLAFWGLGISIRRAWKGQASHMLMVAWAAVAIFMAFAASRFVSNAAPAFAVLMGAATARLVAMAGFDAVKQRYRRAHGRGAAGAAQSLTWKSVTAAVLIGLFLVLPNIWVGVDAGTSFDFDQRHGLYTGAATGDRFGAFGIQFDVDDNGWLALFQHLSTLDQDQPFADRPAFIAWWDYGHWATNLGKHPTVADPFQSHYAQAGRFLASESEQEAVGWLSFLIMDAARGTDRESTVRQTLADHDPSLPEVMDIRDPDERTDRFLNITGTMGDDAAFEVYESLMDATDHRIQYFGVDLRMWPQSANNPGIFYAPAFLANKDPDEFVTTVYPAEGGLRLRQELYGMQDGDSFAHREPFFVDQATDREYVIVGGRAYERGNVPLGAEQGNAQGGVQVQQPQLQPQARFYETMYARAFGGVDADLSSPGDGLTHWRAIFEDTFAAQQGRTGRNTALLEYYRGVEASGTVTDSAGEPIAGATVSFRDGFGAAHARATTDADGMYTVAAPFSLDGDLTLEVRMGGAVVVSRSDDQVQFTRAQAQAEESVTGIDLVVERGRLEGIVFEDIDPDDGGYNSTVDLPLSGTTVTVGDRNTTTDADGRYVFDDILPGQKTVTASRQGFDDGTRSANVPAGGTGWGNVSMTLRSVRVSFHVMDEAHSPVAGAPIEVAGQTVVTDASGNATADVPPGQHTASVRHVMTVDGEEVVLVGQAPVTVEPRTGGASVIINVARQDDTGAIGEPEGQEPAPQGPTTAE